MPDGEDFLWRPVIRGVMRESDLYDRTVNLERFAAANEALDFQDENEARADEWRRRTQ